MPQSTDNTYARISKRYDRFLEPVNAPLRTIGLTMYPTDESMRVLDVGCGTGAHLQVYADSGAQCYGVDASDSMLSIARERLGARATLDVGDARTLSHTNASFDLIFISLVLHELDKDAQREILAEMVRVVKPDGRILVIDHRVGPLRFKGRSTRALSFLAERLAGRHHYRNWRSYLGSNGLPTLATAANLTVDRENLVSGGNLSLWLLKKTQKHRSVSTAHAPRRRFNEATSNL